MDLSNPALKESEPSRTRALYQALLAVLGLIVLLQGLGYWAALLGLSGGENRFDELDRDGRILFTGLAVILPFAGLGLWFRATWGVVVWLLCAALQFVMHSVWQADYGANAALIIFNLALAGGIAACVGVLAFERLQARRFTSH